MYKQIVFQENLLKVKAKQVSFHVLNTISTMQQREKPKQFITDDHIMWATETVGNEALGFHLR